jgi:hypothetical protein
MTKSIITQTDDVVNYENIVRIYMTSGTYDDIEVYALVAQANGFSAADDNELIQLGIFEEQEQCAAVYDKLKKWLKDGVNSLFEVVE